MFRPKTITVKDWKRNRIYQRMYLRCLQGFAISMLQSQVAVVGVVGYKGVTECILLVQLEIIFS